MNDTKLTKLTPKFLLGMKKNDAIKLIKLHKLISRITVEDGKYFIGTDEINADRFNLEIKNGKVINAAIG